MSILPFLTVNQTRRSLKLITADAVRAKALAIDIYLTPFDISTWVAVVVLVFGGTSLIVTAVSKRRGYKSTVGMLKRALLWIYSALLEQPDDSNFSTSRAANGAPRAVLLLTLFMCCAVNNVYRALLNVAYLTGNEFETKWEEVR